MMVSQMAAVVGGAQQESRPVIFPVANRPDFLWLSASLEWLREARRKVAEGGGGGERGAMALDIYFLLPRGQATKVFSLPHWPGAWLHTLFLKKFPRVCEWQG